MINNLLKFNLIIVFLFCIVFYSCKKDKELSNPKPDLYSKEDMLNNIGSNIILANYDSLNTSVLELENAYNVFKSNITLNNLNKIRIAFKNAYLSYQQTSLFEFGPAETVSYRVSLNTFPTDTNQIISNTNSNAYNLSAAENIDAKGFPAIDYLLFIFSKNDSLMIEKYKEPNLGSNRIEYLGALIGDIKSKVNSVYNGWKSSSGNYINTFKSATGSDVGSSISMLVNQLSYDLEIIKNPKLGIPLGKKTLGNLMPDKCEGLYAGNSVQLMKKNLLNIYNTYAGIDAKGANINGLDDYVKFLNSEYNGIKLHDAINNQFQLALSKLNEVPDPLSSSLTNNRSKGEAAYTEIQKLVVILKNDLASAIGIQITYQDSDGD
jgi:predicted lipoprotein